MSPANNPSPASRTVHLQGHLLDSGLMNEILDLVSEGGGTFEVADFAAGRTRDDLSAAVLRVHAPNTAILEDIVSRLIDRGARIPPTEESDARLATVEKDGVAPDDFYSTTIFRTEVRVGSHWIPVQKQRMDVMVVIGTGMGTAECRLMRDLRSGEQVICGVDGIRTFPPERAAGGTTDEFAFMASSVSSERRVETAVEEISRDLARIRDEGGKVVVVAGPVVVHTGGAPYLALMVREGYVQMLLGGNAIAAHDIELSLYGTSLGVNLERGQPVHEGHKHHLKAINMVRGYGSIAQAVQAGAVPSGVMRECVLKGVPFVLAGSIRDDGPLPDTLMDLVEAQRQYQEAIRGADLIIMLSSMLHSIGTGNMTPSGVKLVCVDINPAVVTKLADRGSLESVGIVTDVGLFLRLIAGRLGLV
ncbi:MAG: TIGR00300 family protein [Cytophagales bacterium]|nr:TIGR00300 family protein [Armatimonadota bacterium]